MSPVLIEFTGQPDKISRRCMRKKAATVLTDRSYLPFSATPLRHVLRILEYMLQLDETFVIGKGSERWCFEHPQNPNRCVKVAMHPPKPGRKPQSQREASYFSQLYKRAANFSHLPQYYGTQETSLGLGYVFELVRDDNGQISRRLEDCVDSLTKDEIMVLMARLRSYMLENAVIPCDMSIKNMLVQNRDGRNHLILVDGVGNRDFIPLATYIRPLARMKIARIWRRFYIRLDRELGAMQPLTQPMAREI